LSRPQRIGDIGAVLLQTRLRFTTHATAPNSAPTPAVNAIARFEEINHELALLSEFRAKPAGTLRITAGEHAAITVLQLVLAKLLPKHPDINIEIVVDYGLTDIVAQNFDAGVRHTSAHKLGVGSRDVTSAPNRDSAGFESIWNDRGSLLSRPQASSASSGLTGAPFIATLLVRRRRTARRVMRQVPTVPSSCSSHHLLAVS
jgi:DNA-binding transcriptional LysR family regulator